MFHVLLPEQFHFTTQAGGGGPGAKRPAEWISIWNSRAPQRKPGRRSGHAEAEEAGGDDKDRARRYDFLCVYVRLVYGCRNTFVLLRDPGLHYFSPRFFLNGLSFSTAFLLSVVSFCLMPSCGHTRAGNTDVTVFPVCAEPLPM